MLATRAKQPAAASPGTRDASTTVPRTRARRPLRAVETNVASYDRKDPFAAFNALRKLLASLPSMIGGCRFKMSEEEQKLSMHLLTIADDCRAFHWVIAFTSYLDVRDLLALALSCKRMHDVIFPRHYEYRVIRCKISNIAIWSHLAGNRALAANVRHLEILDERSTESILIPSDVLITDTELESSDDELVMHDKQGQLFMSALSKMASLGVFVWSCNHSLISLHSIWPTLLKCHSLKSVEINDNLVFGPVNEEHSTNSTKRKPILPKLSSVLVRSFKKGFGHNKNPELTRVSEMLHHCPNLEELDIHYNAEMGFVKPQADDFSLYERWPNLRTLTLTHLTCALDGFEAASSFLLAHPNIEVPHLDVGPRANLAALTLTSGFLPRLRELKCSKELACMIMTCPSGASAPRPLETIKGVSLTGQQRDHEFLDGLRRYTIKRIELAGYSELEDIRKLVDCVPNAAWLDIGKKSSAETHKGPVAISSVVDWANLLTHLPDLSVFHGVRFFYEVSDGLSMSDRSRIKKNDEVASVIAWKCPNLRRLDHWDEHADKVIVLLKEPKDGEKIKWEIRRIKL
ncbi:hypothetical protein EW145_g1199 [Phellinidium pouzarii]|uniref:F-box domain-containing protein n=1 Tax=Phellinidium pouzarii TaxID=167371 RepID=A0A4S4LFY3_9AGAM|nr:hypothetical protein EW145_g1199 [Phellinidium pouzarii]